jgi:hypothetical protein
MNFPCAYFTVLEKSVQTGDDYNNNSVKFFIIYVMSQERQGQLQTQHSVDTDNYITDKHNIKVK